MHEIGSLSLERKTLAAVHRSWGFPTDEELLWLLEQGIDQDVLWPIGGAKVHFARNIFELDDNGGRALIFRATDRGEVVDLVAWEPQTGVLASWRGQAFCLGDLDDVFNPATYFADGALHVHENENRKSLLTSLRRRQSHRWWSSMIPANPGRAFLKKAVRPARPIQLSLSSEAY